MKIGCISWSYRNEFANGSMDIHSWIRHCRRDALLEGVEIWSNHLTSLDNDYLDSVSGLCKSEGLTLYGVAAKCQYGDFSKEEVEAAKNTLRTWLTATDRLGAPLLRISVGGRGLDAPSRKHIVFSSIAAVLDEGSYPHITVGIENQEPGIVANADDVAWMDYLTDGKVKLILDNGSIVDKASVYEFMERSLPYAADVHLKFFEISENGADRVLDYERIIPILRSAGYDGFVSIEYDSQERASDDVPKIAAYLRGLLGRS